MRTLTRIFLHNLHLKVTAVILAVLLWAVVLLRTNPWTVQEFEAEVVVRGVPQGLEVMSVSPPKIKVSLAGRRRTVERVDQRSLRAYASGGQEVGQHETLAVFDPGELPRGVEVLSPNTYAVTLNLDREEEQTRVVLTEFRGRPAPGYAATQGRPQPTQVTIKGPRTLVQAVTNVVATIDISSSETTRTFEPRLEARDARGMPQQGVTVNPPTAKVEVAFAPINVRTVPVKLDLSLPPGRAAASVDVYPPVVTITGKPEVLRPVELIRTKPARVTHDDVLPNVELSLPAGISIVGGPASVRVAVTLEPLAPRPRPATSPPPTRGSSGRAPAVQPESGGEEPPTPAPPGSAKDGKDEEPPPPTKQPEENPDEKGEGGNG